jgi:hypothetical protein
MKSIAVVLDRERNLRYTWKSLRHLQRMCNGMPLLPFINRLSELSADDFVKAIAAGLEHEWPQITIDDAEQILECAAEAGRPLQEISPKIIEALVASGVIALPKNRVMPVQSPLGPVPATPGT